MEMLFSFGLALMLLPASFVILGAGHMAGRHISPGSGDVDARRNWGLFLLVSAIALTLPFALFSASLFTDWGSILALLCMPALMAILSMIVINWRSVYEVWRSNRLLLIGLVSLLILLLATTTRSQPIFLVALLAGSLIAAGLWAALRWLDGGALLGASILSCLLLFADASGLASQPFVYDRDVLHAVYNISATLVPFLALGCAALLIRAAFNREQRRVLNLLLAGLILLLLAASIFRSALMVSATWRAAEDHLPFFPIMASVVIGLLLGLTSSTRRGAWVGISFSAVASILLLAAFWAGSQVDPLAITVSRAQDISRALQEYHQDHGNYPGALATLTPGYLPILLGPLNGRGQRWCYQAEGDSYRLAVVNYRRYWTPPNTYTIELLAASGEPLVGAWMCDAELNRMTDTGGL